MSARFIVATDGLTADQETEFRDFVTGNGGIWWHWIANFWLVYFRDESSVDEDDIFAFIIKQNPRARVFILRNPGLAWTVTDMKNSAGKRMPDWLERNWNED